MAHIKTPKPVNTTEKITSLEGFLKITGPWQRRQQFPLGGEGFLGQLWYRGVNEQFPTQVPGVYRPDFMLRAGQIKANEDHEDKSLRLEREMLSQFRTAGAAILNPEKLVETYFIAQHFGLPTRLLDWSTNPLAALFFACDGEPGKDGVVFAMDARKIIPPKAQKIGTEPLYQSVMTMHHPFVRYAVGVSFWEKVKPDYHPHILPVRPDIIPGRIGQQSSCFTLHMHRAPDANNDTMITIVVEARSKKGISDELRRMNVNLFTIYSDLDHLSLEIKRCWLGT